MEAIAGADRAIALAAELGLPKPAFTLHMRGVARTHLGDGGGIDDLREALALGLEQGLGRETAVIHGNLCGAVSVFDGPEAGFEVLGEAITFPSGAA